MTKEELEKEAEKYFKSICEDYNEEYERTGKRHYFVGFDIKNGYLAGAEPREKRIVELEKENAELKDYAIQLKTETARRDTELTKQLLELDKERIKAKELLRDFLSVAIDYIDKEDKNYSFIVEAEQFFKDSEVEK